MRQYLILLCILLGSCGLGSNFFKSTSDKLGISKQSVIENNDTSNTQTSISTNVGDPDETDSIGEPILPKDDQLSSWFYLTTFVILDLITILVFKLKKQNMKSL